MRSARRAGFHRFATALAALLMTGCAVVGPAALRNGRMAYNEAIITTNNQQLLMVAVHNRYEENASLLFVSSVTANVHTTTTAGVQLGYGSKDNYAGNLVPFGAQVTYEENPTISYTPVAGAKYLREVMAPISLVTLAQFSNTFIDPAGTYWSFVSSVNGIRNPDFSTSPADPRFARFVALMTQLGDAGCAHWVEPQPNTAAVAIEHCASPEEASVHDLLNLLGIAKVHSPGSRLLLPVSLDAQGSGQSDITMTTRSIIDLVEILTAAIEVPDEDLRSGAAAQSPPAGQIGARLRVAYSKTSPATAAVAVAYRGGWFYIDEHDQTTKRFFRLLTTLWTIAMAENTSSSGAPVLTVPASR
jgi:hypothetical protein